MARGVCLGRERKAFFTLLMTTLNGRFRNASIESVAVVYSRVLSHFWK